MMATDVVLPRGRRSRRLSGHRGIVTVHSVGILPDGRPYLIMELCPGGSLTQWLKPEYRPSEERVRRVGVRIADALASVHACGVLHSDINPANILIDRFGNPRLADFGLAKVSGSGSASCRVAYHSGVRAAGGVLAEQASEAGDVFSLAATLYALLAGCPPRGVRATPDRYGTDARVRLHTHWPDTRSHVGCDGWADDRPEQRPGRSTDRGDIRRGAREVPALRSPTRQPHFAIAVPRLGIRKHPVRSSMHSAISTEHRVAVTDSCR